MGKEHDNWLAGIGVEVGGKNLSGSGTFKDNGGQLAGKWEHKVSAPPANFAVGPVPFFLKASVRFALEGKVEATVSEQQQASVAGSLMGVVGGTLELGPGYADKKITVGCYGSFELSAQQGLKVSYDQTKEEGKRWDVVTPLTIFIIGTGKLGAKIEIENEASFNIEAVSQDWELYVITLEGWNGTGFDSVEIRDGKDMVRLKETLAKPGPAIEAAVEKYAPESAKRAAEDGAKWAAESEDAKAVSDIVSKGLETFKKNTGVDAGAKVEDAVAYLISDDQETSTQTTRRVETTMAMLNATGEEFSRVMTELKLWPDQELGKYRKAEEWNKVQAALEADRDALLARKEASGAWVELANALAATAQQRKNEEEQRKRAEEQAERVRKGQEADEHARLLAEEAKHAVEQMMAIRLQAMSPGNHLDHKTRGNPAAAGARKFWESGMQKYWTPAELQRQRIDTLPPQQKKEQAYKLTSLYQSAQKEFQTGVQQL